eukprot:10511177-Alexandrium_andersonii.AAC.1
MVGTGGTDAWRANGMTLSGNVKALLGPEPGDEEEGSTKNGRGGDDEDAEDGEAAEKKRKR